MDPCTHDIYDPTNQHVDRRGEVHCLTCHRDTRAARERKRLADPEERKKHNARVRRSKQTKTKKNIIPENEARRDAARARRAERIVAKRRRREVGES